MFRYAVCGVDLRSDLAFPSLRPVDPDESAAPSAIALTLLRSETPLGEPTSWLYTETLGETTQPWRAVGVAPRGFFVRLFGAVDFFLENDGPESVGTSAPSGGPQSVGTSAPSGGQRARLFVFPGAALGVVEPLFLEQALPLWLSMLHRPCLHASAVAWGEGDRACAIAFAGRSGSGKSTLATSLAASSVEPRDPARPRAGAPGGLVADDCLALQIEGDRLLAFPGHRAVRLLEDSAHALFADPSVGELSLDGSKRRVDVPAADRALPLARFYVLEPATSGARATHLRPRDALARIATHLFRIDPEDYGRLPAELDLLDRVAARVRVVRLEVPRSYDALDEVRAVIAADLATDEQAG